MYKNILIFKLYVLILIIVLLFIPIYILSWIIKTLEDYSLASLHESMCTTKTQSSN